MSSYRIARRALLIALALAPAGPAGRAAAVEVRSCADLPVISAGETFRGAGRVPGRPDRLAVEVAVPGVLVLSAAAPGREALAPEIDAEAVACGPGGGSPARIVRTPTALLVAIAEPGLYPLRVVPRDPLLALGPYRVESRFARPAPAAGAGPRSLNGADGAGGSGGGPGEEEEEEIDEVDGEPMNLWLPEPGVVVAPGRAGAPVRLAVRAAGPARLTFPPAGGAASPLFAPVCRPDAAADDHADLPLCATGIEPGEPVAGVIGNRFGDDHDLFTFVVAAPARVTVGTSGAADTLGGLYDARGRRLALDDDGGAGRNFRLEADLEPGRYHVRVEGADGAEGEYRLTLAVTGR